MQVDEGYAIIGLVQRDIGRRVGDLGIEIDFGVVLGENGGTFGDRPGGVAVLTEVLLDEHLLPILVDDALTVSNEDGSHDVEGCGERGTTEECGDGECDETKVEVECRTGEESVEEESVDDNGERSGEEVVEGENCN